MMSDHQTPLQRAHALSAQASILLQQQPSSSSSSSPTAGTLEQALLKYKQAAELFENSADDVTDSDAKKTLQLLTNQHRKLARDLERRIISFKEGRERRSVSEQPNSPSSSSQPGGGSGAGRPDDGLIGLGGGSGTGAGTGVGVGVGVGVGMGRGGWNEYPGIVTRTSPRSIPPFALRPPPTSTSPSMERPNQTPVPSTTDPPSQTSNPRSNPNPLLSPLSSSSSSAEESYYNLLPETSDPFSRFWGYLETMLEDISNPVAFASVPMDGVGRGEASSTSGGVSTGPGRDGVPLALGKGEDQDMGKSSGAGTERQREKERERRKGEKKAIRKDAGWVKTDQHDRGPSPSESFYVVPDRAAAPIEEITKIPARQSSPSLKTPEELALENTSLRASLDALASHAQTLERKNAALQKEVEGRERMVRSIVGGVRREAQKAKQGQEILKSQLLSSSIRPSQVLPPPAHPPPSNVAIGRNPTPSTSAPHSSTLVASDGKNLEWYKKRLRDVEDQLKATKKDNTDLKTEVETLKAKIAKYKANTRMKREARAAEANQLSQETAGG